MTQQYYFHPQPQAPAASLLDPQNNPTSLLTSFADGVFNYLDYNYEPKGSRLLEQDKIAAMQAFILPQEHHIKMQEFRPLLYNTYYTAFSVETSFGVNGPSITRFGFLTYLRAMIMSDPDEAFKDFSTLNQVMRLGPQFDRSQFLRVADPGAKDIDNRLKTYISKVLRDIGLKAYPDGFCDICFNKLTGAFHGCQDCPDYAVCQECFILAPKRHTSGHRFKAGSLQKTIHEGINCDICFNTIVGVRHKCQNCADFDLCQGCLALAPERHHPSHKFQVIERPAETQSATQARYEQQERENILSNMRVRMARNQTARIAEQIQFLGTIG
ncbi:hypothetical protein BGX28_009853 [Mortierella sp. GBA30]|nr:hypothetical protein BGX28_009853 [Mortierella sp. GBA30]